ncbi:MAG: hypothetical protein ACLFPO_06250 [Spirochaetaceae bacterium]
MWTEPARETGLSEVAIAAIGVDRFSGDQRVFLVNGASERGISVALTAGQASELLLRLERGGTVEQSPYATVVALLHDNGLTPLRIVVSPPDRQASLLYHDGVEERQLLVSCGEGTVLAAYLDLPLMVDRRLLADLEPELVSRRRRMDVLYFSKV